MFDLFKLHDPEEDKSSKSWIRLGGDKLTDELRKILLEILSEGYSLNSLSKQIAKTLNVNWTAIKQQLEKVKNNSWKYRVCVPIPVIESLLRLWNNKKMGKEKWKLIELTDWIVSGASKSKPTKSMKVLNKELSAITGAHAADGCLVKPRIKTSRYQWRITDQYESSLSCLQQWIKKVFGIQSKINRRGTYFYINIKNKAIYRILNKFFGFKLGKKASIVSMPKMIKNSTEELQRYFAMGVLTFDGCVDLSGYIELNVTSKQLRNDVANIMRKDGIKVKISKEKDKLGRWTLATPIIKNDVKFLKYFANDTIHWKKANGFIKGFDEEDVIDLFKGTSTNKIKLREVLSCTKKLKIFDLESLRKTLKVNKRTVRSYIRILEKAKIIKTIRFGMKVTSYVNLNNLDDTTTLTLSKKYRERLFDLAITKCGLQIKLADLLNVNFRRVSAWRIGTTGLSMKHLRRLLKICNLDSWKISDGIEKFGENIYIFKG